jgi:hypothetical protein
MLGLTVTYNAISMSVFSLIDTVLFGRALLYAGVKECYGIW